METINRKTGIEVGSMADGLPTVRQAAVTANRFALENPYAVMLFNREDMQRTIWFKCPKEAAAWLGMAKRHVYYMLQHGCASREGWMADLPEV